MFEIAGGIILAVLFFAVVVPVSIKSLVSLRETLCAPARARERLQDEIYRKNKQIEMTLEAEDRRKQLEKDYERQKRDVDDYKAARDAFCEATPGYSRLVNAGFFTGQWVRPDGTLGDDYMSFGEWMSRHYSEREELENGLKKSAHQLEQDELWGTYDKEGNWRKS